MTFELPSKPVLMENIKITNNSKSKQPWFGLKSHLIPHSINVITVYFLFWIRCVMCMNIQCYILIFQSFLILLIGITMSLLYKKVSLLLTTPAWSLLSIFLPGSLIIRCVNNSLAGLAGPSVWAVERKEQNSSTNDFLVKPWITFHPKRQFFPWWQKFLSLLTFSCLKSVAVIRANWGVELNVGCS